MKNKKLVIFDFDGTLNQTHLYSYEANKLTLESYGVYEVDKQLLLDSIGQPVEQFCRNFLPDLSIEELREYHTKLYEVDRIVCPGLAKAYEGTEDSLKKLVDDGYTLSICTNAARNYLELIMGILGFDKYFDKTITLDDRENKTQSLKVLLAEYGEYESAVFVGDTLMDKKAADDCDMPFIGCAYGYAVKDIENIENGNIIHHAGDIYSMVKQII